MLPKVDNTENDISDETLDATLLEWAQLKKKVAQKRLEAEKLKAENALLREQADAANSLSRIDEEPEDGNGAPLVGQEAVNNDETI